MTSKIIRKEGGGKGMGYLWNKWSCIIISLEVCGQCAPF